MLVSGALTDRTCTGTRLITRKREGCPVVNTFAYLFHVQSFHPIHVPPTRWRLPGMAAALIHRARALASLCDGFRLLCFCKCAVRNIFAPCDRAIVGATVISKSGIAPWRLPICTLQSFHDRTIPNGGACDQWIYRSCGNTASKRSGASLRLASPRLPQLG
jgi:hypothetical protein